jgi:LytR cell envelope-related transcriptional attenuator
MKSKSPEPESGPADRGVSARHEEIGGKRFRVGAVNTYVPFRSRTRRRRRLAATAVLGLLVLAAGVYGVVSLVSPPSSKPAAAACPAGAARPAGAAAATALPSPAQITVNVYNASSRHGLAATTAALLKQRGFTIGKVTNDPLKANLTVPAQIRGGTAGSTGMRVIAAEVSGAQLQQDARADNSVDLVLGTSFSALTTPDQAAALLHPPTTAPASHEGCSN